MRTWKPALLLSALLGGCGFGPWAPGRPTICYPSGATVTPDHAAAGAAIVVASSGFENRPGGGSCGSTKRRATYVLQMRTERDALTFASGSPEDRLGVVRVDPRSLAFRTVVTVPPRTSPGVYYVGFARAPGDDHHYSSHCDDTAGCAGPTPNLTVISGTSASLHPSGSVAAAFSPPPPYPGEPWTKEAEQVSRSVLVAAAGPAHCGWQSATFLTMGWPPGTDAQTASHARQFVRDPNHVLPGFGLKGSLDLRAQLPVDARPTGYRYDGLVQLYLAPSDQDSAVYLVAPTGAERWPRSDPMTLCA